MIHIGINALHIKWGVNAGTETYLSSVVYPWYQGSIDSVRFTLICSHPPSWWQGEKQHFRLLKYPLATLLIGRIWLEQAVLPLTIHQKLDVLFHPGYVGSLLNNTKQVITVHDQFAWLFPREIGLPRTLYWKTFIPLTSRKADRVIAVSKNTAKDISRFCKISPSKISVIYEAGNHLQKLSDSSSILEVLALQPKDYFICVGFFKEIKNPWRILEAYKRYVSDIPQEYRRKLVLVGYSKGKQSKRIADVARSIEGVIDAGRVSDYELKTLLKESSGLVYSSLYEGFGIPILEAQSLNCPVITSDVSSMPEVAGKGAILVDPYSVEEICNALTQISVTYPIDIIQRGRENLERFSWSRTSQETLDLLVNVAHKT